MKYISYLITTSINLLNSVSGLFVKTNNSAINQLDSYTKRLDLTYIDGPCQSLSLYEVCAFKKETSEYIPNVYSFVFLEGNNCKTINDDTICYDDLITMSDHGSILSEYIPLISYDETKATIHQEDKISKSKYNFFLNKYKNNPLDNAVTINAQDKSVAVKQGVLVTSLSTLIRYGFLDERIILVTKKPEEAIKKFGDKYLVSSYTKNNHLYSLMVPENSFSRSQYVKSFNAVLDNGGEALLLIKNRRIQSVKLDIDAKIALVEWQNYLPMFGGKEFYHNPFADNNQENKYISKYFIDVYLGKQNSSHIQH